MADQAERDVPVLADRAVVLIDLHHGGVPAEAPAVAHAEVERRADDHDHVGLVEGHAAGAVEMVRVAGRQQSAARAVEVGRDVELAHQLDRLLVAAAVPHLRAEQDAGPLGIDQEVGQLLDVGGIADRAGRGAVVAGRRDDRLGDVDLAVEHVARDLEVGRPPGAVVALARRHADHVGDPLGRRARWRRTW